MSRILLLLCFLPSLAVAAPAAVSGGKTGAMLSSAPASTAASTSTGRGGGSGRLRDDPRRAPPLDAERQVSEQDCTKPVDLTRGNLKCK
jgi:hypothetical protein